MSLSVLQTLWAVAHLGGLALAVLAPFLPLWLMWRAALAGVLAICLSGLIAGPVHWSDQNIAYAFWISLLALISTGVALALLGRLGRAAYRGILSPARLKGPAPVWLECGLCDLAGLTLGLWTVQGLAFALAGRNLGQWFDWAIGATGLAAGIALTWLALRRQSIWPVLPAATLGAIGVITLWAAGQQGRIETQARTLTQSLSQDRPHCIATPNGAPISSRAFFGLPKGQTSHHLILVAGADQAETWHWSIRQQRFIAGHVNTSGTYTLCQPAPRT